MSSSSPAAAAPTTPKRKRAPTSPVSEPSTTAEQPTTSLYPAVPAPLPAASSTTPTKKDTHDASVIVPQTKVRKTDAPSATASAGGAGAQLAESMMDKSRVASGAMPANLKPPPTDRPVRIYSDGIWDLFHFGHAKALEQAKKIFPNVELLVGVCNDQLTHAKKGKTVMTDVERYESLRHCKWVDEVVPDAPWVIDQAFLDLHRIDYVAHDDIPYKSTDSDDVYSFVKKQGRFIPTARTEGVSTSDLITRIVRNYDAYVRRNLERGVSPKELNISFFKEKEIRMKSRITNVKQSLQSRIQQGESSIRQNWVDTKNDLPPYVKTTLDYWDEISTDLVKGFTGLFGQEGIPRILFRPRTSSRDNSPSSPLSEGTARRWPFGSRSSSPTPGDDEERRHANEEDDDEEDEEDEDEEADEEDGASAARGRKTNAKPAVDAEDTNEQWEKQ
ncbi:hypothetical protein HDU89_002596 [Geranomyces variabilis]|nr:hypothetical protein HDU89_002596 [Geranomyces variabilis]